MSLTALEEKRIQDIEALLNQLKSLVTGAASQRTLNRLLVLCNEEVRRITERQAAIEARQELIIEDLQKLQ